MAPIGFAGFLLAGVASASGARLPELDLASLAWQAEEIIRVDALRPSEREGECAGAVARRIAGTIEPRDEIVVFAADYPIWGPAKIAAKAPPKAGAPGTPKASGKAEVPAPAKQPAGPEEPVAAYLFLRKDIAPPSSAAPIRARLRWIPVPGGIRIVRDDRIFAFIDARRGGRTLVPVERPDGAAYEAKDFEEDLADALARASTFRTLMASPESPAQAQALGTFLLAETRAAFAPPAGGLRSLIIARGLDGLVRSGRPSLLLDIYAGVERALDPESAAWLDWSIWERGDGARILAARVVPESVADVAIDAIAVFRGFLRSRLAGQAEPPDELISRILHVAALGETRVRAAAAEALQEIARHLHVRGWGGRLAPHIERLYQAEGYPAARFALAIALFWTAGEERYRKLTGDRLSIACQVLPVESRSEEGDSFEARIRAYRLSPSGSAPRSLALILDRLDEKGAIVETRQWPFAEVPFAPSVPREDRRAEFPVGPRTFGGRIALTDPLSPGTWQVRLAGEAEEAGEKILWRSEPAIITVGR